MSWDLHERERNEEREEDWHLNKHPLKPAGACYAFFLAEFATTSLSISGVCTLAYVDARLQPVADEIIRPALRVTQATKNVFVGFRKPC